MRKALPLLLWLSLSTGWLVSIFSVIQDMCLATACTDAAVYTIFGFSMGFFGIAFFSMILILLWLRKKVYWLDHALSALVFVGVGAEFRLLWIQKYIIGSWCPLCVTICCSLFISAVLLLIEEAQASGPAQNRGKRLIGRMAFLTTMAATGLAIAIVGIKALS